MWVTSSTATALTPTIIALGNFDGIHRGHQKVVQPILQAASKSEALASTFTTNETNQVSPHSQATPSPYTTVVTFDPHPREYFSGESRSLLTPLPEKARLLENMGVDQLVLLPFNRELASLSPQQFVEKILVRQLQATQICVGEDFCFGRGRSGTSADLCAIAHSFGINVNIIPLHTCEGQRISSSAIRQALEEGKIKTANRLLGRSYILTGTVIKGEQLGRTIGFPTANLQVSPQKFLPRFGVYAVRVAISESDKPKSKTLLNAVMNIGSRPTVNGKAATIEVHLLDWSEELYDKTLAVHLEKFLRPEQKFPSLEDLKTQIITDCQTAKEILNR